MTIFAITPEQIQSLDDVQARELVARLARTEMLPHGGLVRWGGNQRAPDGGVDVDAAGAHKTTAFIPSADAIFQVKAVHGFSTEGQITNEMAPKGVLRPVIRDLEGTNGAYIIASTKVSLVPVKAAECIAAMDACFADHGIAPGTISTAFYDARQLADWCQQHPAVAIWVRDIIGQPLDGWRPYGPWAHGETAADNEFLLCENKRVELPSNGGFANDLDGIAAIRMRLSEDKAAIRLIGLSGTGKTRFVQGAFDPSIVTDAPLPALETVVYTDLGLRPNPTPQALIERISALKGDAIAIVDNCGSELHSTLVGLVARAESNIRLATIEYDIQDDLPENTSVFHLHSPDGDTAGEIIRRKFPRIPQVTRRKIVDLSDGNARVAIALASANYGGHNISSLSSRDLFDRLFYQSQAPDETLQRCAEACSLAYSFDLEDTSDAGELATLGSLVGLDATTMYRNVAELQRRGLVQARGQWRAVLPHAIANRLAASALQSIPPNTLDTAFDPDQCERLFKSHTRRLSFLHEVPEAVQRAGALLLQIVPHIDAAAQLPFWQAALKYLAPVIPSEMAHALCPLSEIEGFVATSNGQRYVTQRLLRSLAYDPNLFEQCCSALVRFAAAEPADYNNDPALGTLGSMFYARLSGTHATFEQRQNFVRGLLQPEDTRCRRIGTVLLNNAFEANRFTGYHEYDFGAHGRDYGLAPQSEEDYDLWFGGFLDIAIEFGSVDTSDGKRIREIVGRRFAGLWRLFATDDVHDKLYSAGLAFKQIDGWPEGLVGAVEVLSRDRDGLYARNPDHTDLLDEKFRQLEEMILNLQPTDLAAHIRLALFHRMETKEADEDWEAFHARKSQEILTLAQSAAASPVVLEELRPELNARNKSREQWQFGRGIALAISNPADEFTALEGLASAGPSDGCDGRYLSGLIIGWHERDADAANAFLGRAMENPVWGQWFPHLQASVPGNDEAAERLIRAAQKGLAPAHMFNGVSIGRWVDPVSAELLTALISQIAEMDGGVEVALDILHRQIFNVSEMPVKKQELLASYCLDFCLTLPWADLEPIGDHVEHEVDAIMGFGLAHEPDGDRAGQLQARLITHKSGKDSSLWFHRSRFLKPMFKHRPMQFLNAISILPDVLGEAVGISMARDEIGPRNAPIDVVPDEVLLDWCDADNPESRALYLAATVTILDGDHQDGAKNAELKPIVPALLQRAGDKAIFLGIVAGRLRPSGWTGSLAAIFSRNAGILESLKDTAPAFSGEIGIAVEELKTYAATEEAREREEHRQRNERFE